MTYKIEKEKTTKVIDSIISIDVSTYLPHKIKLIKFIGHFM